MGAVVVVVIVVIFFVAGHGYFVSRSAMGPSYIMACDRSMGSSLVW